MVKSQLSNKSMTPLYVDTDIEYELDMKLFPGFNNPEARMQPSLMIHKDVGCPCQQNADVDLQNLIESCVDLECSESDSFIDEILGDIHESSTYSTSHTDDVISSYCSTPAPSSTDDYQMDMLFTGIIPLHNNVTPDITTSLLNIQEQQTPESTNLFADSCDRKGVKRKLFSLEEDKNNNIPPAKRQHVFICDDETVFSIFHDLFNHIQVDKKQ